MGSELAVLRQAFLGLVFLSLVMQRLEAGRQQAHKQLAKGGGKRQEPIIKGKR